MRRLTVLTFAAALAVGSIGCETTTNSNLANKAMMNGNANSLAIVVNNNTANTMTTTNANTVNYNVSRAEYDKDRTKYEAEKGASSFGTGVNDSYMWFKTKGELATVDGLRDSTINVDVTNDVITLKGTVATAAQKEAAEKAAKSIEGQKGVKNELKVQAGDSMTNQMVGGNDNTKMTNSNTKMTTSNTMK